MCFFFRGSSSESVRQQKKACMRTDGPVCSVNSGTCKPAQTVRIQTVSHTQSDSHTSVSLAQPKQYPDCIKTRHPTLVKLLKSTTLFPTTTLFWFTLLAFPIHQMPEYRYKARDPVQASFFRCVDVLLYYAPDKRHTDRKTTKKKSVHPHTIYTTQNDH